MLKASGLLALIIVEAEPYGELLEYKLVKGTTKAGARLRLDTALAELKSMWCPASEVNIAYRWL